MIVTTFPRTVRVIEHTLIPLRDGTMLAARIWLPDDAEQSPVPAILEYLPYRKRPFTANSSKSSCYARPDHTFGSKSVIPRYPRNVGLPLQADFRASSPLLPEVART